MSWYFDPMKCPRCCWGGARWRRIRERCWFFCHRYLPRFYDASHLNDGYPVWGCRRATLAHGWRYPFGARASTKLRALILLIYGMAAERHLRERTSWWMRNVSRRVAARRLRQSAMQRTPQ